MTMTPPAEAVERARQIAAPYFAHPVLPNEQQRCLDGLYDHDDRVKIAIEALSTPANVAAGEGDWFTGDEDCDGNKLVTIRADELQRLRHEREKFMWQVRDTCVRAEKAEAALSSTAPPAAEAEVREQCALLVENWDGPRVGASALRKVLAAAIRSGAEAEGDG